MRVSLTLTDEGFFFFFLQVVKITQFWGVVGPSRGDCAGYIKHAWLLVLDVHICIVGSPVVDTNTDK